MKNDELKFAFAYLKVKLIITSTKFNIYIFEMKSFFNVDHMF
jgi:hypothetical protein